ncbi:ribonuclease [Mycolicibacterium sp. P9-64]|uniref:ribonuclease domain-containing protein n=1 Tax=Mycolicibacterium sp. P9-64 TaxID=2024612 RepID=UPI0011EC823D|nr:ribonuclease domain-containing protein [Mycolicibacterium sp. P9-64]KAA0081787.1 ribonuclease [Mycolicibacterium sp. P9-64]
MGRNRYALVAVVAFVVIVGGWALFRTTGSDSSSPAAPAPTSEPAAGMSTCALTTLPPQAAETVRSIHAGGPFPFPRNDGVVFGNREGHLPNQAKGYYHEYTVITPGAKNRSTRRIITGGTPLTKPPQYFYTADHYDSFCLIPDAGGQR